MPYAPLGDIQLYYELHGPKPGEAPALVFAHGIGGNHLSWWQQVPLFRKQFACVTFDHRGFGLSHEAAGGPGSAAFADDLRALLDHLGIARASLVAQSMGGWTCLRFAVRYPTRVEKLVMCDSHGGLRTPEIDTAMKDAGLDPKVDANAYPAAGARMVEEQPQLLFLFSEISACNPARSLAEMNAVMHAAGTLSPGDLASLTMPVLFLAGDEDIVIPPRVLELAMQHIPGARMEIVPLAGHSVYFERADTFNEIVGGFLRARIP